MVGKFIEKLIDKQFEMIGVNFRFKDIPDDNVILVNKKKKYWWEVYKFKDVEQYGEWRKYLLEQLKGNEKEVNRIDFCYGLIYEYKKEEV